MGGRLWLISFTLASIHFIGSKRKWPKKAKRRRMPSALYPNGDIVFAFLSPVS